MLFSSSFDFEIKGFPFLTPASLVAYKQLLFNATFLIHDLYSRPTKSKDATVLANNSNRMNCLKRVLDCLFPDDVKQLVESLNLAYDPKRHKEVYIPSFACASFKLEFGRIIPPTPMIIAHNFIANVASNSDPISTKRRLYSFEIITYDNVAYTVSDLFGKYITTADPGVIEHPNWLNNLFDRITTPVVNGTLTLRPTLSHIDFIPPNQTPQDFNIYDYLLSYSDDNREFMHSFLNGINHFLRKIPNL